MNTDSWSGIFFLKDEAGLFCGETVQPTADFEIPAGKTLTIGENQTLIIPEGVTMTVNGTLTIDGSLTVNGTLINNGMINGKGTLDYENGIMSGEGTVEDTVHQIAPPEPTPEPSEPSEPETPAEPEEEETYIPL